MVFTWVWQGVDEGLNVTTHGFLTWVIMDALFSLILKVKIFIFCVSFSSHVSQMFIVCNDFVGEKHGFHI
jgi:hypothetical protein